MIPIPLVSATVTCEHCDWTATMRGEPHEVDEFLAARFLEHCQETHPEVYARYLTAMIHTVEDD